MTRWQFFNSVKARGLRMNIIGSAACCLTLGIFTLVANVIREHNLFSLVDVFLMVVIGLLIYFLQSRVVAIILAVIGLFNVYALWAVNGEFAKESIIVLIIAVYAIIYTFKFQKAWKEMKAAQAPEEEPVAEEDISEEPEN